MGDNDKSKEQLIDELEALCRRLAQRTAGQTASSEKDEAPKLSAEKYRLISDKTSDLKLFAKGFAFKEE